MISDVINNDFYTTILYNDFYTTILIQRFMEVATNDFVALTENGRVGRAAKKSLLAGSLDKNHC